MTQDEIIKLAREADLVTWLNTSKKFNSGCWWIEAHEPDDCLFKFAELVTQRERERCAELCDELDKKYWQATGELMSGYGDAIRERGQQ